jgi:hypothetical protein
VPAAGVRVLGMWTTLRPARAAALVHLAALAMVAALLDAAAGADFRRGAPVERVVPPSVTGVPAYGSVLVANPGVWHPSDVTLTYRWLLDGEPVGDGRRHRPARNAIGEELVVEVTGAVDGEAPVAATSAPVRVQRGTLLNERRPAVEGVRRFGHRLVATAGEWSSRPDRVRYRWLRDGEPVKGATGRRYEVRLADFGTRLAVRVVARKAGFNRALAESAATGRIKHRVPVRHTVTYHVATRGRLTANLRAFRAQAQATFDDPRGWRGAGVAFRRVDRGGDFTLVLSEASQVPTFSSGCSAQWSCRVGRFVIINQTRWLRASPMWHQADRSRRDYRHMVVNHETGHWLGHGHRGCTGRGDLAPVMQQQSIALSGCRPNPWPTAAERRLPRFG